MSQPLSPLQAPLRKSNWMHEPLAVVGMACRLPGGDDLEQFWQLLIEGRQATGPLPESFFNRELYFTSEKNVRGKSYSDVGGLIQNRPLDWSVMPLPESRADCWDPCHLILCEVAARALRNAGLDPCGLQSRRAGVYIGHSGGSTAGGELAYQTLVSDYVDLLEELPQWQQLAPPVRERLRNELLQRMRASRPRRRDDGQPSVDAGCAAGLLAQAFGLNGPHMSIDAACASSLVALALSAAALAAGQIDMAIVGGASFNKFDSLILFSHAQSCSAGQSRPFDAAADGLISSEGYVVFVIKTLAAAVANGDKIEAVIHGIGVSSDGRGRSLWAPRKEGQHTAIHRAYANDVTADSVQMVEAHATSTQVGDATEMEALAAFFREQLTSPKKIPVGSVKSNIGHTLETAGLAGLVKAILAIQHGVIPPSINVQQLNKTIPWNETPLEVVRDPLPWPSLNANTPRRAAVNAFGIGGLNVHVIVDQYLAEYHRPSERAVATARVRVGHAPNGQSVTQSIAVVGRGLVVPGALDVKAFANLLATHSTKADDLWPIITPPKHRWRELNYKQTASDRLEFVGGFITDYSYDWRKHKVPPKQIAQANPLQFMLLEAAEQALREAGYLDRTWNRQRAAVVVGSVFGAEFGNSLYAGLRLPEFKHQLLQLLQSIDANRQNPAFIHELWLRYEELFLKSYPALLDETGSFTSSTLASRLSKTFDLMGGAMAVDSGEASGMAALDASVNLLRSGAVDYVLCATGHSAMDRASVERLYLNGQLATRQEVLSAAPEARRAMAAQIPAEGVALLLVRRLEDAIADGEPVLATIDGLQVEMNRAPVQSRQASRAQQIMGNLWGAQSLVDIIECSLNQRGSTTIHQAASSGLHYTAQISAGQVPASQTSVGQFERIVPIGDSSTSKASTSKASTSNSSTNTAARTGPSPATGQAASIPTTSGTSKHVVEDAADNPTATILRVSACDREQLIAHLQHLGSCDWKEILAANPVSFDHASRDAHLWRAALVAQSEDYRQKALMLGRQVGEASAVVPLAEQGLYWSSPETTQGRCKVAWLFPGQGSQSIDMLRDLARTDAGIARTISQCDAALAGLGEPSFAEIVWSEGSQLGENVWHTQAAMLISDYVLMTRMTELGFQPDVVGGHSFGEFAAMLAAGCWSFESALKATWYRCRAITENVSAACAMLSIQARPETVESLIRASHIQVTISHRNAPEQTVVGGKQSAVAQFAQVVDNEGLTSRLLAVPTAFHTPALSAATEPFSIALRSIDIEPPRIPILSSVHNRYVADPLEIKANLAAQLVTPLNLVGMVERLIADGVRVVVEVGPQQVLTRLVRQTAGSRLTVLSTDHPKRGTQFQLLSARAGLEVMLKGTLPRTQAIEPEKVVAVKSQFEVIHFDATSVRRARLRAASDKQPLVAPNVQPSSTLPQSVIQFDASQPRRDRNRQQAPTHVDTLQTQRASESSDAIHPASEVPIHKPTGDARPQPVVSPAMETTESPVTAVAAQKVVGLASIEAFLIDFVVEQTGYPAEIIELDWDIEADLGIDSIKKAQLFGELREFFDLESLQSFSLDNFKTLRDISNLLASTPGKGDWLERSQSASAGNATSSPATALSVEPQTDLFTANQRFSSSNQVQPPSVVLPVTPTVELPHAGQPLNESAEHSATPPVQSASASMDPARLQQFLVDFVVEQTGYPPEIVEMDADLEADLGIDSIKKAQLFGELREMFVFPVSTSPDNRLSLSEFRTLRSVLELLLSMNVASSATTTSHLSHTGDTLSIADTSTAVVIEPTMESPSVIVEPVSATPSVVSATGKVEPLSPAFRNLVPLERMAPTGADLTANRLPIAVIDGERVRADQAYNAAVFENLQAMAGRSHRAGDEVQVSYNGERERAGLAVSKLAQVTGAADISLLALDACLAAQSTWSPLRSEDFNGANQSSSELRLRPIADLAVPHWLQTAGVPIAAHIYPEAIGSDRGNLELLVPGCVTSAMFVTSHGLLMTGGKLASQDKNLANEQVRTTSEKSHDLVLHTWLRSNSQQLTNLQQFERAARATTVHGDWWLQCVELRTGCRVLLESRQGVVVIEKGWLPGLSQSSPLPISTSARLYWDTAREQLLVQARLKPTPHAPIEVHVPIQSLCQWADIAFDRAESTSAASTADVTRPRIAEQPSPIEFGGGDRASETAESDTITNRYILRMVPAPQRVACGRRPTWSGAALIIGDNPVATQLEARLRSAKVPVTRWVGSEDPMGLANRFEELARHQPVRHLFLTTPCDPDAQSTLDRQQWQRRRNTGLMSLFWLCQRWHAHVLSSSWVDDASLVAVTSLGGDFGLQSRVQSIEGGALTGLLKAILIESWVQGFRTFPIKVLDTCRHDSPAQIVDQVWQELAVPSFDLEVAYCGGERHVVRAIAKTAETGSSHSAQATTGDQSTLGHWPITRGGTWVCTGGARGITAYVAEQLATRYELTLHLLGTQPQPSIPSAWRNLDDIALRELKAQVMTSARAAGKNPVTTWQDTEKSLEIDRNLRAFRELGIEVHYHACDVSDRDQVAKTLARVRELSGPIQGVLHGAGIGKDARFDRKLPEKVNQCIGAKIDGAWSLIEATWHDPLEAFISFGSISGRFGANGHTDYSLANDMLCKQMDWLRTARPEVHAVGFHWHAWGDIGMATKPETRLALEMINMQFMPAVEGVEHLLRELDSRSRESEVLITDDRYYRLFYSPEALVDAAGRSLAHLPPATPLLAGDNSNQDSVKAHADNVRVHYSTLNPAKDPFLTDHRLDDRPLLPVVIGAELLLEAARAHLGKADPLMLVDVKAVQGLRFYGDAPQTVRIKTMQREDGSFDAVLLSDFHARDGRLVERDRVNLKARAAYQPSAAPTTKLPVTHGLEWRRPEYPVAGSKFYVGLPLQRLRGFAFVGDGLVGRITAPALIELAGGSRQVRGWQLPSSAVDACLFATGILAWQQVAPGSALPASFGEISLGRQPHPGEACTVHVRMRAQSVSASSPMFKRAAVGTESESLAPGQAAFDFTLYGVDGDVLVNVRDYRVAWLTDAALPSATAAPAAQR